jgi:uncharacterized protein YjbJ (UPF0337 family)
MVRYELDNKSNPIVRFIKFKWEVSLEGRIKRDFEGGNLMTFNIATTDDLQQLRGKVKDRWDKFTRDDLNQIEAKRHELVDMVQDKYGLARDRAQQEVDEFLDSYSHKLQDTSDNLAAKGADMKQALDQNLERYNDRLEEAADKLPGDINRSIAQYPWVVMTTMLCLGVILGLWLKPCWGSKRHNGTASYQA